MMVKTVPKTYNDCDGMSYTAFLNNLLKASLGDQEYPSLGTETSTRTPPQMNPPSIIKLPKSELNKRNIWKMRLTWKMLKGAIFIICVACFSWQSAQFLEIYFTYPTTTHIELAYPEVFINPAITLCNTNP
ncbi:hypothetical protein NPIL_503431 [Nephila pilipes]|uniref:Uncharacterized protein n=1 Tax=Nephila pilipes TaxID=299642 RepID=A0A8X6NZ30_NEPPI|nr:hypothetical protein NPIL_503431 [Nephila pilipes]